MTAVKVAATSISSITLEVPDPAADAGATPLKAAKKSLWGYGGVVCAREGTIWKVATSSKKDTGPATRQIDDIVLLLGVGDVIASKRFYVDRGLTVKRSFGRKYVEFAAPSSHVKLALCGRSALPKTPASRRTAPDRTGSSSAAMPSPSPTRTGSRGRPLRGEVHCDYCCLLARSKLRGKHRRKVFPCEKRYGTT